MEGVDNNRKRGFLFEVGHASGKVIPAFLQFFSWGSVLAYATRNIVCWQRELGIDANSVERQ